MNLNTNNLNTNSQENQDTQEEIVIPCNEGYKSQMIQLTQPDTHIAIYTIKVTYEEEVEKPRKIITATPHIQYPIYVYENYNLDEIIQGDFDWGILDYNQRVYYIMEEDDHDDVVALLGILYCYPECEPGFASTGEKGFYFDCAEWNARARVEATKAFNKDFVYPISENRDKEAEYE